MEQCPRTGYLGAGVCCWGSKNTKDEEEEKEGEEEEGSVLTIFISAALQGMRRKSWGLCPRDLHTPGKSPSCP